MKFKWFRLITYPLAVLSPVGWAYLLGEDGIKEINEHSDAIQGEIERHMTVSNPDDPLGNKAESDSKTKSSLYWGEQYLKNKK